MPNEAIQTTEKKINDILFNLCLFVTIIAIAMSLVEFFTRGAFPSTKISVFYVGVLIIYSLHKEALRWIEERGAEHQQRRGECFVYIWIIVTAVLYLVNFLAKDYFCYSPTGQELPTLTEITFTTLEVGAVFIFTRLFKIGTIYFLQKRKEEK
jgi:hypothetical protein